MEKDGKQPYIRQQAEGENLYARLQRETLTEVQRLSGKVWTDYNIHDPGVTLADITNYMLAETDYKLGFNLTDYLTAEDGKFNPERFGLFLPNEVYTTTPVTAEDYRKLFFAHVSGLDNVWVECDAVSGSYTVKIVLPPFGEDDENKVVKQVKEVYHGHRNLCEYLREVIVVQPEELEFHAEFEIEPGKDASVVLAKIYWTILNYLSGGVNIFMPKEMAPLGMSSENELLKVVPEEWLEGSEDVIRVIIPRQQNTEYELYKKLWQVEGIHSFSTCYLMKNGEPLTDFFGGFSLKIPKKEEELKVCIRCGRFTEKVDMKRFKEYLKIFYYTEGHIREQKSGRKEYDWGVPNSTYRNIFSHTSITEEFPACYRLSPNREIPTSFEAYLKLYDKVVEDGLKEVEYLPRLLSLFAEDFAILMEKSDRKRDILMLKSRYLDFLDRLYGVESHPVWLSEQNSYGETEEGTLLRRMNFLRHVAGLIKNRARARNIIVSGGEGNAPMVKEWFCLLLGINESDEHIISNVLPSYNLQLIEKKPDKPLFDRIDSLLIDERMLEADNVLEVDYKELSADEAEKRKEYNQMRQELPIFNENRISGDLFRGGTRLDNYKIVKVGKDEYMLVFHNRERSGWTNLGRADGRERLNTLANILRRTLRDLNQECETIYVIEPVLTDPERPFRLLVVLPIWTQRFHTPRFREKCGELLRTIIPAHLTGTIYWLDEGVMRKFEGCYRQLMRTLGNSDLRDYGKQLLDAIYELLKNAIEMQELDDKY